VYLNLRLSSTGLVAAPNLQGASNLSGKRRELFPLRDYFTRQAMLKERAIFHGSDCKARVSLVSQRISGFTAIAYVGLPPKGLIYLLKSVKLRFLPITNAIRIGVW
jgi:hypothetical protein